MHCTRMADSGHTVFTMKDGVIAGADAVGGLLDGIYEKAEDGDVDISVALLPKITVMAIKPHI